VICWSALSNTDTLLYVPLHAQVLMSPKDATGRDITWHNTSALEGYVRRLSAVAVRKQIKIYFQLSAADMICSCNCPFCRKAHAICRPCLLIRVTAKAPHAVLIEIFAHLCWYVSCPFAGAPGSI
jgi:hypothetical protein